MGEEKNKDVFGKALLGFAEGGPMTYKVRRDDGWVEEAFIEVYFQESCEWSSLDKRVLDCAKGRVLDVGAGAGRHSLYLQKKRLEVFPVDISPGAIQVMKSRGVKNVQLMDVRDLGAFADGFFDTVLLMFNNFGLFGEIEATRKFLRDLHQKTAPSARLIATLLNPHITECAAHLAYHRKNEKAGRSAGQVKIRIEYKEEVGDWFWLLLLAPGELRKLIAGTGWLVSVLLNDGAKYGVVLGRI